MNFFLKKPKNFNAYIQNRQSRNSTINFLRGRRLYDVKVANQTDLEIIKNTIDQLPIHVGIISEFAKSMQYFSDVTGIEWQKEINVKRITFKRPAMQDLDAATIALILENNPLDYDLYQYGLDRFNQTCQLTKTPSIRFTKDKYAHVIPYVTKTCLFEFSMQHKTFIKKNFIFFKDLTFYLLKEKKILDGFIFVQTWNATFVNTIRHYYGNSNLEKAINLVVDESIDPLEQTYQIGQSIEVHLIALKNQEPLLNKPLVFIPAIVAMPVIKPPVKQGLFKRIFKKKISAHRGLVQSRQKPKLNSYSIK